MGVEEKLCIICSWRRHCQIRFTPADDGEDVQCHDFTRDYTINDVEADRTALEAQLERWGRKGRTRFKPCITISREAGARGSEIGRRLAAELRMDLLASEIISRIAESTQMSAKVVQSLGERHITLLDNWISSFFAERHFRPDTYFQHLVKVIKTAGEHGNAIILGRGAGLILPQNRTFRVRVIAPFEKRIENVINSRGCGRDEARRYVIKGDDYRKAFIMKYFHEDIASAALYDLVVNMAGITIDDAVVIIKQAFQVRHFSEG